MSESVVVVIMVDSSLPLAAQWSQVLVQYISPLLSRLIENRSSTQFHLGFLTYSTAEMRPTPIIAKRYFAHPQQVTKELKEEPQRLGLGRTGTGGRRGMAALEGFVAALELFDLFLTSRDHKPSSSNSVSASTIFHIIHISYVLPDGAQKPLWNHSAELDHVSWKTLPEEVRKRNIHLSMVLLQPNPRLTELHSLTSPNPNQPWFQTRTGHSVLLSGFPAAPHTASQVPKRQGESGGLERTPDPKRARVMPSNVGQPSSPAANVVPPLPHTAETAGTSIQPTVLQPTPQVQPSGLPPPLQIAQRMRVLEAQIKAQVQDMQVAQQAGRTQEADNMKRDLQMKTITYMKLKSVLSKVQAASGIPGPGPAIGQATGSGGTTVPGGNSVAQASTPRTVSGNLPPTTAQPSVPPNAAAPDRQALAQLMQSRFSQPLPAQPPMLAGALRIPPNVPPEVAAQMQKLLEQQHGRSPRLSHQQTVQQSPQPTGHGTPAIPPKSSGKPQTWHGSLTWTGFDPITRNKREVTAQVVATGTSGGDIRADTWPLNLTLAPSRERHVQISDLHAWIKRYGPKICTIMVDARNVDPKVNESNFKSLNTLLLEKSLYALASWELPSGKREVTMVIFPVPGAALAAAVFPETGVPELPKAAVPNPSSVVNPSSPAVPNLPPGFQNWTQQQKQEFAAKMLAYRQHQQMLHQTQASLDTQAASLPQAQDSKDFAPGQVFGVGQNVANSMGGVNMHVPHNNLTGFAQPQPGASGMQNLSMEMLQSFMQRNPDSMGGP